MKLKNLLSITLSVFLSTQVVMGATYIDAKSNIEEYEIPSAEKQKDITKAKIEIDTVEKLLEYGDALDGNFIIDIKNKSITGYAGHYDENVVIPSALAGVNIEEIGYQAFISYYNLKSVTLPEGLKRINSGAFYKCYNLENVTIPSTVEYINESSFYGVDTVYLPYHTPDQLNSRDFKYGSGNEIFGARRAIYGTGENQIIIEDKNITRLKAEAELNNKNNASTQVTNTKNESAKSVKLKVGEKVATVNDISVALDTPAYINSSNNSVYVPLRFVSVALVGEDNMMWDASTKTVAIFKDSKSIKFTVGNNNMIVDGKAVNMGNGIVPEIKDGRVFVPFRPLGEALGMNVKWDSSTKTAIYE